MDSSGNLESRITEGGLCLSFRWSYSSLSTYEKCAAQYRYRYEENIPWPQSQTANRGQIAHTNFEAFLKGDVNELPSEFDYYTQFLSQLKTANVFPEIKLAFNEKWDIVEWDSNDVWFRCVMDLLVETPDEVAIYDWKTGKVYDDHFHQREIYAIAGLLKYPDLKQITTTHVYLDIRENRKTVFPRELALNVLRPRWEERVARLRGDADKIPFPGFHCRYCPYSSKFGKGPCQF